MPIQTLESLRMLCLELLGLTLTMAGVVVIATYWYFGSFALPAAQGALGFTLLMLFVSALPLQLYAATRIVALRRRNKQLFHIATRDGLTKVLNRAAFQKSVELRIGPTAAAAPKTTCPTRCWFSTPTISSASTTGWAMAPATRRCPSSPPRCA